MTVPALFPHLRDACCGHSYALAFALKSQRRNKGRQGDMEEGKMGKMVEKMKAGRV